MTFIRVQAKVRINLPGGDYVEGIVDADDHGSVSIFFPDERQRVLEVISADILDVIEVRTMDDTKIIQYATQNMLERHAEKQGCSISEAYKYFEDLGYNMKEVD